MKPDLIDGEGDRWVWDDAEGGYVCKDQGCYDGRSREYVDETFGLLMEEPAPARRWERPVIPADVKRIHGITDSSTEFLTRDGDEWISDSGGWYDADSLWEAYEVIVEVIEPPKSDYELAVEYFRTNFPRLNEVDPVFWAPTTETKKHMITLINTALEVEGTK